MTWRGGHRRLAGGRGSSWLHGHWYIWRIFRARLPDRATGKMFTSPQDCRHLYQTERWPRRTLCPLPSHSMFPYRLLAHFPMIGHQAPVGQRIVLFTYWLFASNMFPINCSFQKSNKSPLIWFQDWSWLKLKASQISYQRGKEKKVEILILTQSLD